MSRARRTWVEAVTRNLRPGHFLWTGQLAARALRLRLGLPGNAPIFATLAVTYRCNYRCSMCDLPLRARKDPDLSTLMHRLGRLKETGALAVGITGGEPLLRPDLLEIIAEARRLRLLVHLNTNGSILTRERMAGLVSSGLHSMNVSLDGVTPSTHDELRGVPGSFHEIEETIREFLSLRGGRSPRLALVMTVSRKNLDQVQSFPELAHRLGADTCGFLPHHDFVAHSDSLTGDETRRLATALQSLEPWVDNSPDYLRGIPLFLSGQPTPTRCSAPKSHLAVDPDGQSYPCVPLMTLSRAGRPLEEAIHQRPAPSPRDREEVCRRCWWNCHRELDLLLQRTSPLETAASG